jgi:hypothetical protein
MRQECAGQFRCDLTKRQRNHNNDLACLLDANRLSRRIALLLATATTAAIGAVVAAQANFTDAAVGFPIRVHGYTGHRMYGFRCGKYDYGIGKTSNTSSSALPVLAGLSGGPGRLEVAGREGRFGHTEWRRGRHRRRVIKRVAAAGQLDAQAWFGADATRGVVRFGRHHTRGASGSPCSSTVAFTRSPMRCGCATGLDPATDSDGPWLIRRRVCRSRRLKLSSLSDATAAAESVTLSAFNRQRPAHRIPPVKFCSRCAHSGDQRYS